MIYIRIQIYYVTCTRQVRAAKARIKTTRKAATIVSGLYCPIEYVMVILKPLVRILSIRSVMLMRQATLGKK